MALNASTGMRREGIFPPQAVRQDVRLPEPRILQKVYPPAHTHPQPTTAVARRSVEFKSLNGNLNLVV